MNIILYVNGKETTKSELLIKTVELKAVNANLEIYHHFEDLFERINRLPKDIDAAILYAQSVGQLSGMIALKDLMDGVRVLLILPNREKNTVSMGLDLFPRFVGYSDSEFEDFAAILEKMMASRKSGRVLENESLQ